MLRRFLDLFVALIGLLLLSPLFVLLVLLIRLDSAGPVFYGARRVGLKGRPFTLYKFRTMVHNADQVGPGITVAGDARVTRIGRVLRRYKLDELPQLLNVLKGEMSLVGPRPEDPRYVALYTPEQRQILTVRPGLTSPASLAYRHEAELLVGDDWETTYVQQVMPDKLALEQAYLQQRTLGRDLRLLFQTARVLLWRR